VNTETELIDFLDQISFTMSKEFIDRWKSKYGERILKLFQSKLLASLKKQKPIKVDILFKFLVKDSGFNPEIVYSFLIDVDFELYQPILSGSTRDLIQLRK
jgi:hypothetical protein